MDPRKLTIAQLGTLARREGAEAVEARMGPGVLVGPAELSGLFDDDEDDEPAWSYMTQQTGPVPTYDGAPRPHGPDSVVYGIIKAGSGPFADTVLIGRASSNDIHIDDSSISKLHARIRRLPDGTLELSDAGSRNGTFRGPTRLTGPVVLEDGDRLRFGDRRFTFRMLDPLLSQLRHTG